MIWLNMDSTLDTLALDAAWGAESPRGREKDMMARKEGREDGRKKEG